MLLYYFLPRSNGCPDAFGAWDDFENNTRAISVTTYGNTFSTTGGITESDGITCDTLAIVLINPKKNAAPKIPSGFH